MTTEHALRRVTKRSFEDAEARVRETLAEQGFGVLTEIDVKKAFKEKLDLDFRPYKILGACNPKLASQALGAEPQIGALLPCNVVVSEALDGRGVTLYLIKAVEMFKVVGNADVGPLADEVDARLARVLAAVGK